jgi:DNA phosphorothioation-dependent restriction protein DptF
LKLIDALSILSKSSPFAVSTDRVSESTLSTFKKHIYIQTDIEADFKAKLLQCQPGQVIFLCGSSGDGKSEILTQHSQQWQSKIDFHLDATHSFSPSQTAIDALDNRFRQFKESGRPLVVGINIGMLGNYAEEGAEEHAEITGAIKAFLEGRREEIPAKHVFMDFEDYPKFSLTPEGNTSDFALQLIKRLTEQTLDNPFFALHQNQVAKFGHDQTTANFSLLGLPSVQQAVIDLLLKARLVKDQFLTARALLDFLFQIMAMQGYLFDNLFSGGDNELLQQIKTFDPSNLHTKNIDEFVLQFGLGIADDDFEQLKTKLKDFGVYELDSAASCLRFAYLFRNQSNFGNRLIESFKADFNNVLVEQYASIWLLHKEFDGSAKQKKELNKFYKETLIAAVHRYCNRHTHTLDKDAYFISEYNGFKTAAELEVKPNFNAISGSSSNKIGAFIAQLMVDDSPLKPIPVSMNLLGLLQRINQGYRPNKHDKNAVLLLDEVIEQIVSIANEKETLLILKADKRYKVTNEDNEYFEVSGL